jgi:large repetitive protein
VSINITAQVIDTATGYSGTLTDTDTINQTMVLDIIPVTDNADITSDTSRGDEDSYITLDGLNVDFIDKDGSETMSIEISGVPTNAVLVIDNGGGNYTVLPNNGVDGGSFNGEPTYKWSITESQLANLAIRPPLDFSGDIPMSVSVIGYEKGTTDYVTTEGDFVLEVLPIADPSEITTIPGDYTGVEGQVTVIELAGSSTETFSNETLILSVKIETTSDDTAFLGLDRIRVGSVEGEFVIIGGYAVATLEINASEMHSFELLTGPYAFGHLDLEVGIITKDSAIVGGVLETDLLDNPTLFNITVDLSPEVDAPDLTLNADSIFAVVNSNAPLGLDLDLINPATAEVAYVEISGVPAGISISNASQSNGIWTIQQSNLDTAMLTGLNSEQIFDLTVVPVAELSGDTSEGAAQTLSINVITDTNIITANNDNNIIVAGPGDDQITGGLGNDQFVFNSADQGGPANDNITDFSVGSDSINLTDLLRGVNASTGGELDYVIDLSENAGATTIAIKVDGNNILQNIVLDNTSMDDLYGSDVSGVSEADMLTKLIDDQILITGQV